MQRELRYDRHKYILLISLIGNLFLYITASKVTTWKGIPIVMLILSVGIFLVWFKNLFSWAEKIKKSPFRRARPYILGFIGPYVSLIALFSFMYYALFRLGHKICPINSPIDYFYFSTTTATTLGYGDIKPTSFLTKLLSMIEVSFGVIFLAAVLTVVLSLHNIHISSENE